MKISKWIFFMTLKGLCIGILHTIKPSCLWPIASLHRNYLDYFHFQELLMGLNPWMHYYMESYIKSYIRNLDSKIEKNIKTKKGITLLTYSITTAT